MSKTAPLDTDRFQYICMCDSVQWITVYKGEVIEYSFDLEKVGDYVFSHSYFDTKITLHKNDTTYKFNKFIKIVPNKCLKEQINNIVSRIEAFALLK